MKLPERLPGIGMVLGMMCGMRTALPLLLAFVLLGCFGCGSSLGSRCVGVAPIAPPRTSYYQYNKDISVSPAVEFRWQAAEHAGNISYDIAVWKVRNNVRVIGSDGKVVDQPATLYEPSVFMDASQCRPATWWGKTVFTATEIRGTSWRCPTPLRRGLYGWTIRLREGDRVSGWCYAEEKGISADGAKETTQTPFLFTVVDPDDPPPPVDAVRELMNGFRWP